MDSGEAAPNHRGKNDNRSEFTPCFYKNVRRILNKAINHRLVPIAKLLISDTNAKLHKNWCKDHKTSTYENRWSCLCVAYFHRKIGFQSVLFNCKTWWWIRDDLDSGFVVFSRPHRHPDWLCYRVRIFGYFKWSCASNGSIFFETRTLFLGRYVFTPSRMSESVVWGAWRLHFTWPAQSPDLNTVEQ